jgi:hypothetical protein
MDEFSWLKEAINKIDVKVDRLDQRLDDASSIQAKNTVILEEHQRRSLANEKSVELIREEMKPVRTHVDRVEFIFKIIGFLTTAVGLVTGSLKLFNVL